MMFDSLRFGILLAMFVVAAVAITTITIFAGLTTRVEFSRYVEVGREIREESVAQAVIMWLNDDDEGQNQDEVLSLNRISSMQYLTEGDAGNAIDPGDFRFRPVGTLGMLEAVNSGAPSGNTVRFTFDADGEATIFRGSETLGTLLVDPLNELELVPAQNDFVETVSWTLVLAAVLAGVAAITLTIILSRRILHPVAALTLAARTMETGDMTHRVKVHARGEIAELANAFNAMATTLERNEDLRRNMVSDIAHELRTPLTNIRGYLEALQDHVLEPDTETINLLHEEALILHRLIQDLQELALAEAGQLRIEQQQVQLVDTITQGVSALHPTANNKGVKLKTNLPNFLPPVLADERRVAQILRNLLNNAITHTSNGGTVSVDSQIMPHAIRINVRDTGEGISEAHLPFVFERFYRADPSRSRATGGAGLGLAIVRNLVEAQGGRVTVASVKGEGTRFSFTLPRCTLESYTPTDAPPN